MDPMESVTVMGAPERMRGEYWHAINHVMCSGPYCGQVAAMALMSDEGLVELDRMAADESADGLDRVAALVLTNHPHSVARLNRLRGAARAAMAEREAVK